MQKVILTLSSLFVLLTFCHNYDYVLFLKEKMNSLKAYSLHPFIVSLPTKAKLVMLNNNYSRYEKSDKWLPLYKF